MLNTYVILYAVFFFGSNRAALHLYSNTLKFQWVWKYFIFLSIRQTSITFIHYVNLVRPEHRYEPEHTLEHILHHRACIGGNLVFPVFRLRSLGCLDTCVCCFHTPRQKLGHLCWTSIEIKKYCRLNSTHNFLRNYTARPQQWEDKVILLVIC